MVTLMGGVALAFKVQNHQNLFWLLFKECTQFVSGLKYEMFDIYSSVKLVLWKAIKYTNFWLARLMESIFIAETIKLIESLRKLPQASFIVYETSVPTANPTQ